MTRVLGLACFAASVGLACATSGSTPHRGLEPLWRDYRALPPKRALAVAGDPDRVWVAGAAGGRASESEARSAALDECLERRLARRMQAPCRIYAVGDRIVW